MLSVEYYEKWPQYSKGFVSRHCIYNTVKTYAITGYSCNYIICDSDLYI